MSYSLNSFKGDKYERVIGPTEGHTRSLDSVSHEEYSSMGVCCWSGNDDQPRAETWAFLKIMGIAR